MSWKSYINKTLKDKKITDDDCGVYAMLVHQL